MKNRCGIFFVSLFFIFPLLASATESTGRYFLEGDGKIILINTKTNQRVEGWYRLEDGTYPEKVVQKINHLFGVPVHSSESISLRLISLLDFLQDHFHAGTVEIISGYRSSEYNERLRRRGRLAAKTSMHIEGMAADINIAGVDGRRLWEYARSLNCCGAGYYHGTGIHIDTGPSRFWDEKSTKVEQNLGGHNKLLLLRTEEDIYQSGETVTMMIGRVTDYPISIKPEAELVKNEKELQKVSLDFPTQECISLKTRKQARSLHWKIPEDLKISDKFQVRVSLCDKHYPEMPDEMVSNWIVLTATGENR